MAQNNEEHPFWQYSDFSNIVFQGQVVFWNFPQVSDFNF